MINLTAIIITSIICLTALAGGQIAYKALLVQLEIRKEENKPGPFMRALFKQAEARKEGGTEVMMNKTLIEWCDFYIQPGNRMPPRDANTATQEDRPSASAETSDSNQQDQRPAAARTGRGAMGIRGAVQEQPRER
jgi:hypothetical protein